MKVKEAIALLQKQSGEDELWIIGSDGIVSKPTDVVAMASKDAAILTFTNPQVEGA